MNAARRDAKIARAKTLRPHRREWRHISVRRRRWVTVNRHYGDGALRTVYGELPMERAA